MSDRNTKKSPGAAVLLTPEEILSLPADGLMSRLGTSAAGISAEEATVRLETYGSNEVARREHASLFLEFASHFKSPLVIILIVAAIVSGVLGQLTDAIIILSIVIISVVLDFTQEYRAGKAAEALRKRVATTATVLRDGTKQDIEVAELVPGDVVALTAGDVVPADARVIGSKDFFVDQSALTGESFPVEKMAEPAAVAGVGDTGKWNNYLFMGTSVTNGTATAVVFKTGAETEYGEIIKKNLEKKPETEFERGLRRFGYLIIQVTFVLVVFVFFRVKTRMI